VMLWTLRTGTGAPSNGLPALSSWSLVRCLDQVLAQIRYLALGFDRSASLDLHGTRIS